MAQRISEEKILIQALYLLAKKDDKTLTTSELIYLLTAELNPTGKDADLIPTRSDTYFSQKVRNIISHRNSSSGIVTRGLAIYDQTKRPGRLKITPLGEAYISKI